MQQALLILNHYIAEHIPSAPQATPNLGLPAFIEQTISRLLDEALNGFQHANDTTEHIHLYQRAIQRLAALTHKPVALQAQVISITSAALTQLRDQFPGHFNYEEYAVFPTAAINRLVRHMNRLNTHTKQPCLNKLLDLLVHKLQSPPITWRWLCTMQQFFALQVNESSANIDLLRFLVENNLNLSCIKDAIIAHFKARLNTCPDPADLLLDLRGQLNNYCCIAGISAPGQLTLREQLELWLHTELTNYAQQTTVTPLQPPVPAVTTSLSVNQLAAFLRLLMECRIISCTNQVQLLNIVAANIRTANTAAVSPQSLRNKYYDIGVNTFTSLKDICMTMFQQARRMAASL